MFHCLSNLSNLNGVRREFQLLQPPEQVEQFLLRHLSVAGESGLDAEDLCDDGVVATGPVGEGGCRRHHDSVLWRREDVEHGVEAVRDGVPARAEAVGVVGGREADGGVDGVEDAGAGAAEEPAPVVKRWRWRRRGHRRPRAATKAPIKVKRVKGSLSLLLKDLIPIKDAMNSGKLVFLILQFPSRWTSP